MATKDILGTHKVRTKPEYTAKTHWAGLVNFDAIFMAPVLYLLVPVFVLYITKSFLWISDQINKLVEKANCNQYLVMGFFALILWQFVVCSVWWKHIRAYESAPKYEYHFYNDIIEYKSATIKTPTFITVLTLLVFLVPIIALIYCIVVGIIHLTKYVEFAPPAPPSTPGESLPGLGGGTEISIDWAGMWSDVLKAFNNVMAFLTDEANKPLVNTMLTVLAVIAVIAFLIYFFKPFFDVAKGTEAVNIPAKTLPARTLPAIISAVKKLPAPSFMVPENCPRWLKKIIFWAPVHYNFGDVIISSPKGACDDVILNKIESPEKLVNYLAPIKPKPTEVAGYSAKR